MKERTMKIQHFALASVAAAALVACGGGGDSAPAPQARIAAASSIQTAQGIWSDIGPAQPEYVVVENVEYVLQANDYCQTATGYAPAVDGACSDGTFASGARSYFTTVVAATAAGGWKCSGNATTCAASNQPAMPAQPDPWDQKQVPGGFYPKSQCQFWSGSLADMSLPSGISVTLSGLNGKGNWTYTWDQVTATALQASVDPRTAFGMKVTQQPGTVDVSLAGNIYGQSVQSGGKNGTKYSFSITESDGSLRVTNPVITLSQNGALLATFDSLSTPAVALSAEMTSAALPIDYAVPATADMLQTNGTSSLLASGPSALDILNTDSFAGNDNGGSDGSALARAKLAPFTVTLGYGAYAVGVSANVKSIDASGTVSTINIPLETNVVDAPTCH
jgi:hypothetical protein